ncbi:iron transporter [Methylobacterium sp. J-026]|uniref:iron transporter n=1 Tax=Methylobacterium sp. J-026 TaxID=2836624 RepID=UPI001FBAEBC2|nr:iron transporter [Methylobacterium sp. J-026]MCJ2133226.1 iron transporter [Methylobacterium sp. J-026]
MSADAVRARVHPALACRLAIAARVLLAILGGYMIAALASGWLALVLPGPRAEAVSTATLASFAIMAAAVIWVFAARSLGRAALVMGVVAALLSTGLWLAGAFQGGSAA